MNLKEMKIGQTQVLANKPHCDMTKDCAEPVSMIDNKGFAYCTKHGEQRKSHGVPCRKMSAKELETINSGKPIGKY